MSTVDADVETPGAPLQESDPPGGHTELTSARLARVGDVEVRRLLPLRRRRSVGLDGGQRALRGGPGLPGGAPARSPARPGPAGPPLPRLLSRHPAAGHPAAARVITGPPAGR
jgi:hypothetical protein